MKNKFTLDKNFLTDFKQLLEEASKIFNRPAYAISIEQLRYVSKGRGVVSLGLIRAFGFVNLKNYCAPAPNISSEAQQQAKKLIEKLLSA